jgi:thiamine-monophosphate kinase
MSDERTRLAMIKRIFSGSRRDRPAPHLILGVEAQDDAAVLRFTGDNNLVVTTDFIRGSGFHLFELGYLDYYDVGYYLVVANLSDIAAMGARPIGLTTVIRYNPTMTDEEFIQVCEGIRDAASAYGVVVIGGDTGGYGSDVLAATAFGVANGDRILRRSGARAGDLLCVAGPVGLPITAIAYFKGAKPRGFALSSELEERLLRSWKRPTARITEGTLLSERGLAHACQDVSDGLKATIEQISLLSGVNFTIREDDLPVDESTKRVATFLSIPFAQLAMSASPDFALLFTIPRGAKQDCDSAFSQQGLAYCVIGEANSLGRNLMALNNGSGVPLPGTEWNHQEGDLLQHILNRS